MNFAVMPNFVGFATQYFSKLYDPRWKFPNVLLESAQWKMIVIKASLNTANTNDNSDYWYCLLLYELRVIDWSNRKYRCRSMMRIIISHWLRVKIQVTLTDMLTTNSLCTDNIQVTGMCLLIVRVVTVKV